MAAAQRQRGSRGPSLFLFSPVSGALGRAVYEENTHLVHGTERRSQDSGLAGRLATTRRPPATYLQHWKRFFRERWAITHTHTRGQIAKGERLTDHYQHCDRALMVAIPNRDP